MKENQKTGSRDGQEEYEDRTPSGIFGDLGIDFVVGETQILIGKFILRGENGREN